MPHLNELALDRVPPQTFNSLQPTKSKETCIIGAVVRQTAHVNSPLSGPQEAPALHSNTLRQSSTLNPSRQGHVSLKQDNNRTRYKSGIM